MVLLTEFKLTIKVHTFVWVDAAEFMTSRRMENLVKKHVARLSVMAVILLLVASCANTAVKLNALQIGMSKYEVYQTLGPPEVVVTPDGDSEFLEYSLSKAPPATTLSKNVGFLH